MVLSGMRIARINLSHGDVKTLGNDAETYK